MMGKEKKISWRGRESTTRQKVYFNTDTLVTEAADILLASATQKLQPP